MDDGVRSLEDPWRYGEALHDTLADLAIPYVTLGNDVRDIAERVDRVVHVLTNA